MASAGRSCAWTPTAGTARRSTAPDPVHPVALAAAGPGRAGCSRRPAAASSCCVATRGCAGSREPRATTCSMAGPRSTKVEVAAPPADPLTATADGLWIDLRVTPTGATAPVDVTEHLKLTEPGDADADRDARPRPPRPPRPPRRPRRATPTATATPSATPTPAAPSSPSTAAGAISEPLCDHPLGFTFARGDRGYRSVATPATSDAKFGTREISAPVDRGVAADARARDAQRQGGYAALDGEAFALRDGIGDDGSSTTQAIAFAADGTGFTGGTIAFGAVSRSTYSPDGRGVPAAAGRRDHQRGALPERRRPRPRPRPAVGAMLYTPGQRLALREHLAQGDSRERALRAAARHRLAAPEPADRAAEPPACSRRSTPTRSADQFRLRRVAERAPAGRELRRAARRGDRRRDRVHAVGPAGLRRRRPRRADRARRRHELAHPVAAAARRRTAPTSPASRSTAARRCWRRPTGSTAASTATDYVRDDDLRARMRAAGLPAAVTQGRDRRRRRRDGRRALRARQRDGAVAGHRRAAGAASVRARRLPRRGRQRPGDRVRDAGR